MKKNVAIIGAGTVGLSVALRSLEVCENINVTIIAAEFLSGTTSFGSGGLWEPYQVGGKFMLWLFCPMLIRSIEARSFNDTYQYIVNFFYIIV